MRQLLHAVDAMESGIREAVRPGAYAHIAKRDHDLVLIVEDYDETREMYAEFLEFAGFRVAEAGTGNHAIKTVHERHPSLVIMDLSLPDMNGCQAAALLRRDVRTMDIPIIALTAYSRHEARDMALRAGCDIFLEKPLGPNELAGHITDLLRRKRESTL
jgi:two-component system cell cycle response regulator DivK